MFTRRKVTSSPSLPKFKRQIKVTDSTDKDSADGDYEDSEHSCSTLPYEADETLHSSSTFTTDEDNEDVETLRNASMFTTDEDYEEVEILRNASMFTTDEDYEDIETFRNTNFFNFDTDQLVVPSTKFLFDDSLGENLKCSYPVASSTHRFSETSRFEKTNHHKSFKHIKEPTFVLPKPPYFDEEKDGTSDIQLGIPKACSTFLQPQGNDGTCDIHLGIPKACSTLLKSKEKELVFKSLSCCQSEILSSFDSVTLLPERTFANEIQDPLAKKICADIANATESTATSGNISMNNYFSHKNSASTKNLHGSNFDMSELNGVITNSFPKICSKQRLEAPERLVKDQLVIKAKSPIEGGGKGLKNQHELPKSNSNRNHAICCLSNTVQTLHPLKVMKPYYRTDVPIDDLCK